MVIFHSYVSLPEGILILTVPIESALWIPLGQKLVLKREAISYQDEIDSIGTQVSYILTCIMWIIPLNME